MRISLLGQTLSELKQITVDLKLPKYIAIQIAEWIYQKRVSHFDEMTNISKAVKKQLETSYSVGQKTYSKVYTSKDETKKYLYTVLGGKLIETVMIPEKKRKTLCISTQAGCKMACKFCATGELGFKGQLTTEDIVNQLVSLPERDQLTNIVFMGMGEPLDNYLAVKKSIEIITANYGLGMSHRRVTLSTVGIIPEIEQYLIDTCCNLAISLHNPFHEERQQIIPIEKKYPIRNVIELVRKYKFGRKRKLSFEYVLFKDFNDTDRHIDGIIKLLKGLHYRINLIPYNTLSNPNLKTPGIKVIEEFQEKLNQKGIITTIRRSRGTDIQAACGMLAGKQ